MVFITERTDRESSKMEFRAVVLFFCVIFIHCALLALASPLAPLTKFDEDERADINQVRKQALQRCDRNVEDVRRLINVTMSDLPKREDYLMVITKNERQYGDGILDFFNFEVGKYANSAFQMATVKFSPDSVFRCIETREKEGKTDIQKYFNDKFLKPGKTQEDGASKNQKNELQKWNDYYIRAARDYSDIYNKAIREINLSNSESQIVAIVNDFDKYTREMADIVVSINYTLAKIQIQSLQVFDKLVADLKTYSRTRADKAIQLIQDCVRKGLFVA